MHREMGRLMNEEVEGRFLKQASFRGLVLEVGPVDDDLTFRSIVISCRVPCSAGVKVIVLAGCQDNLFLLFVGGA